VVILKGSFISQSVAIADRLEGVLERLEAALAAREAEQQRLLRVESAAVAALAELDDLLEQAGSAASNDEQSAPPWRSAERHQGSV